MKRKAVAIVLLVVLAGCVGSSSTPGETTSAAETPTTAQPTQTSVTNTPTTTPSNPWQTKAVIVSVNTGEYNASGYVEAVRNATAFWNEHADASNYDYTLEFKRNAEDPDISVTYQPRVQSCGSDYAAGTFFYCTDTYDADSTEPGSSTVRIAGGYTANATTYIVRDAFADLLYVPPARAPSDLKDVESPTNRDPWPTSGSVVIGIDDSAANQPVEPLVTEAVEYWEETDSSARNYSTDFTVKPNASNPDVLVQFTPEVTNCEREVEGGLLGCAPILNQDTRTYEQELIQIKTGYTASSTLETLKHELGHLHGRLHGQAPMPLMSEMGEVDRQPEPDASSQAYPWRETNLSVALAGDYTDFERQQVGHALTYFEQGADGFLSQTTPSFTVVEDTSQADIVVRFESRAEVECGSGKSPSCGDLYGYSTDADDALEYYSEAEIRVGGVDQDTVGWHVGYWLAYSFGADEGEYPEPLDQQNDDRDGNWWE